MTDQGLAAWKLPPIVAGICVSIVAAFYVGGPGMGMAEGSLVAGIIVVMAVRRPPLHPIVPPAPSDLREHLLVVVEEPLEDGTAIEKIAAASVPLDPTEPEPEVRVVAPAHNRFLDRWACDVGPGRERAQRSLVLSLASLARAGVDANARIGDEDIVQTVTDQLRTYRRPRSSSSPAAPAKPPRRRPRNCAPASTPRSTICAACRDTQTPP